MLASPSIHHTWCVCPLILISGHWYYLFLEINSINHEIQNSQNLSFGTVTPIDLICRRMNSFTFQLTIIGSLQNSTPRMTLMFVHATFTKNNNSRIWPCFSEDVSKWFVNQFLLRLLPIELQIYYILEEKEYSFFFCLPSSHLPIESQVLLPLPTFDPNHQTKHFL